MQTVAHEDRATHAPAPLLDLVRLMRPHQWYKNVLLFAGLVFSGHLLDATAARSSILAFAVFCGISSGIYTLNDVTDVARDRLHPTKRERPVASGRVGATTAAALGIGLVSTGLAVAVLIGPGVLLSALAYVLLQAAYLIVLKHQVFLDILSIASGFLLRAIAGVAAVGVALSPWLLLCTFFLALFFGLGKRRQELALLGDGAADHRATLGEYSSAMLAQATAAVTAALVMSYSLYVFHRHSPLMLATVPFATYGIFRFLYLIERRGGEAETLLTDRATVINALLWGGIVLLALYGGLDARIAPLLAQGAAP